MSDALIDQALDGDLLASLTLWEQDMRERGGSSNTRCANAFRSSIDEITALRKRVEALEELTPDQVYQRVVMEMSNGERRKPATDIAVMLHDLWPNSDFARHALQPNGEAE